MRAAGARTRALPFLMALAVLLANGRPIGSGDTHAAERTAGSLVERGTLLLPQDPDADPFTRPVDGGRISIYPVLPVVLAAPVFYVFGLFFDLNPVGLQMAGKLAAALLSALAVAFMARAYARRASDGLALGSALIFGLGTSVYSSSQALWQHPAVVLFMVLAIDALERHEDSASSIGREPAARAAALCLALAAASRPAALPMCATLFGFLLLRARTRRLQLIAVACLPAIPLACYNWFFFGAPWRFGPGLEGRFFGALPESAVGLLVSPARGILIFTPVALLALLGLLRAARDLALPRGLLAAASVHFAFVACWNEWHGGESFGPRLLTDLLPALFYYLPEGLKPRLVLGTVLGVASFSVQLIGGWTYDYRWERLHQRGKDFDQALWAPRDSPVVFALREGVVIQGLPRAEGRRLRDPLYRWVPFGPTGSRIDATEEGVRTFGEGRLRDIRMERGARIDDRWISLAHPADALAFRSAAEGAMDLQVVGSVRGVLSVETRSGSAIRRERGAFDLTVPLTLRAGDDIYIRAPEGELRIARVEVRPAARP